MASGLTKVVAAGWSGAIIVCGKCSRKVDGFGPKRRPLATALRKALGVGKGRKARLGVVETRCLGICPKRGVMVIDTRRPDRWLVVPEGADIEALAADLHGQPA